MPAAPAVEQYDVNCQCTLAVDVDVLHLTQRRATGREGTHGSSFIAVPNVTTDPVYQLRIVCYMVQMRERIKQVRQQDAYPRNRGAVKTVCNTPAPFKGQDLRR